MKNLLTIILIAFISLNVKASDTKWELASNVDNWDSYFSNSMISENMLRLFHYTLPNKIQELNEKCKSYERILQSVHKFMNHTLVPSTNLNFRKSPKKGYRPQILIDLNEGCFFDRVFNREQK